MRATGTGMFKLLDGVLVELSEGEAFAFLLEWGAPSEATEPAPSDVAQPAPAEGA